MTERLFPELEPGGGNARRGQTRLPDPRTEEPPPDAPLADRMRPRTLDELEGQEKAVGEGTALRRAIEEDSLRSLIFWGPPGSGKTTLAWIIARHTRAEEESGRADLPSFGSRRAI